MGSVAWPNFFNGFAGGFIFVPLTTMTMSKLRKQEIGNAAGIYNLMRNIGGSVGIATITTCLVRGAQTHQNYLAANVSASNPAGPGAAGGACRPNSCRPDPVRGRRNRRPWARIYRSIQQQAALLAYADNFRLMGYLSLLCIPLLLLLGKVVHRADGVAEAAGE